MDGNEDKRRGVRFSKGGEIFTEQFKNKTMVYYTILWSYAETQRTPLRHIRTTNRWEGWKWKAQNLLYN